MLPFALGTGVLIARLGASLVGRPAALAALLLHCLDPVVLANASGSQPGDVECYIDDEGLAAVEKVGHATAQACSHAV